MGSNLMLMSGGSKIELLPFLQGGSGRYMYWLVCNGYTVAVPTTQYVAVMDTGADDAIIASIELPAGKNFSSLFYRAVDQCVYVCAIGWYAKIDADPASGTFNTVIANATYNFSSAGGPSSNYLPFPLDFISTGGSQAEVPGVTGKIPEFVTSDGLASAVAIRMGGHSNWPAVIYYHHSQLIAANNHLFKVVKSPSVNFPNVDYTIYPHTGGGLHNDLNPTGNPIRFGNFIVFSTGSQAYLMSLESSLSQILGSFQTLGAVNRTIQEYCPNAPNKLFFTAQITENIISVLSWAEGTYQLTDLGDINRAAYKDTNESGAAALIYNPYSGRLYCMANNNSNLTGVSKVHVYDPTEAVLNDMYVRTVTVGEFKSDARVSVQSFNTVCMNRTRIYEYNDVFI